MNGPKSPPWFLVPHPPLHLEPSSVSRILKIIRSHRPLDTIPLLVHPGFVNVIILPTHRERRPLNSPPKGVDSVAGLAGGVDGKGPKPVIGAAVVSQTRSVSGVRTGPPTPSAQP